MRSMESARADRLCDLKFRATSQEQGGVRLSAAALRAPRQSPAPRRWTCCMRCGGPLHPLPGVSQCRCRRRFCVGDAKYYYCAGDWLKSSEVRKPIVGSGACACMDLCCMIVGLVCLLVCVSVCRREEACGACRSRGVLPGASCVAYMLFRGSDFRTHCTPQVSLAERKEARRCREFRQGAPFGHTHV